MNPRISMITLGVSALDAAISFYEQGLGFPRMSSPPEVAFFTLNGTWLGLYARQSLADDAAVSAQGHGFKGCALAHNVGTEEEVDLLLEQARQAGAVVTKAGTKTDWGGYAGYFQDLDGHLWEIAHNPHFWVGPEDSVS